jgi:hypothetical protein
LPETLHNPEEYLQEVCLINPTLGVVSNPVPYGLSFGQPYPGVPKHTQGPKGQQPYLPQGSNVYPPQGANVYPPQGETAYPPQGKTVYPPQPNLLTYTP